MTAVFNATDFDVLFEKKLGSEFNDFDAVSGSYYLVIYFNRNVGDYVLYCADTGNPIKNNGIPLVGKTKIKRFLKKIKLNAI